MQPLLYVSVTFFNGDLTPPNKVLLQVAELIK